MDTKSKQIILEGTEIKPSLKDTVIIDTAKLQIENSDTLKTTSTKVVSTQTTQQTLSQREYEGLSDAKFNGEPMLIQLELSEKVLAAHPDTIKNHLRREYLNQERNFPRSIADNFEKGISTERIYYPKLNYRVELFKNEYEKKPFQVLVYSVRKENEKIIVE